MEAAERAARTAATAATTSTTTAAPAMRGPKIETLALPDYSGGQLKDYARFRHDLQNLVGKTMADEIQLMYIKDKVPKKVRDLVDGLSTMKECWELLDLEYGTDTELVDDQIRTLKNFWVSKGCKGTANKFLKLYEAWAKVYSTLDLVDQADK